MSTLEDLKEILFAAGLPDSGEGSAPPSLASAAPAQDLILPVPKDPVDHDAPADSDDSTRALRE